MPVSRVLAGISSLLLIASVSTLADHDPVDPFWILAQTYYRIQRCIGWSDHRMVVTRYDQLMIQSVSIKSTGDPAALVDCFLSDSEELDRVDHPNSQTVIVYLPAYDNGITLRGEPVKRPEALIAGHSEVTLFPLSGDSGIEDIQYVSGQVFLVQVGMANHSRIYKVDVENVQPDFLFNGSSVSVENPDIPTFRVNGSKFYFKTGGAFWIDTIIDWDGNILDVVSSKRGASRCLDIQELMRTSTLDLSRVDRNEVCIES